MRLSGAGLVLVILAGGCAGDDYDPRVEGPGLSAECPSPTIVYLNRHGGVFQNAFRSDSVEDFISVQAAEELVTFAPWPGSEEQWRAALACLEDLVADFNIEITDVDPGPVDHLEILVVGDEGPSNLLSATNAGYACPRNRRAVAVIYSGFDPCLVDGLDLSTCYLAGRALGVMGGLQYLFSTSEDIMGLGGGCRSSYSTPEYECSSLSACRYCDQGDEQERPTQSSFDYMQRVYGPACRD